MNITDVDFGRLIITMVVKSPVYASKVVPYLKKEYFNDETEVAIVDTISKFFSDYNKAPNPKEIVADMQQRKDITHLDRNIVNDIFSSDSYAVTDLEWLMNRTENFIKRARMANAFAKTFEQFEKGEPVEYIPEQFQEALNFSFDLTLGRSYVNDRHDRYELYTSSGAKKSLMLAMLNRITHGGVEDGTLNCLLAGTGVGKSMFMCDLACKMAKSGMKVLYISMEMAEHKIEQRVDANLMDVDVNLLAKLSKEEYTNILESNIREMITRGGDIVTKQYPTSSAHAGHFHMLITEYKNRGMEFDMVFIDYLNICDCKRNVPASDTYTRVKCIAEELRALAIIHNFPIITATQTNRSGQNATDLDFEDVSESHGLAATLDLFLGLISSEELEAAGRIQVRQIKNRYGDKNTWKRFPIGVERAKMRFYDLRESEANAANVTQAATAEPSAKKPKDDGQLLEQNQNTGGLNAMFDMSVLGKSSPDA